ncbi:MAG: putative lipid II flippase FtsW [Sandaracinus sp.]|nr:putative lipid II flippase FtsW [Sandaracinus sp.]MCB9630790.1 putative lipid II flippase FtsW [Sandaracinus sp.]
MGMLRSLFRREEKVAIPKVIGPADPVLTAAIVALVGFGVVMVFSASSMFADERYGSPFHFLVRQGIFAVIGLGLMLAMARFDYHRFRPLTYPILGGAVMLLFVVVLGLGRSAGGAARWIQLGPINVQPAEAAKVAVILWLAYSLSKKSEKMRSFQVGFLPHILMAGFLMLLCLKQPDFGSAVMIGLLTFVLLFAAGARLGYLLGGVLIAAPIVYLLVAMSAYRMRRIQAFLEPFEHRYGIGYQIAESLMSFGAGGATGVGLGDSKQKLLYLPEAHTDFISAIVGEELGFVGMLCLVATFALVVVRGLRAAMRAADEYGTYIAIGITFFVGAQAFTNLSVAMGMLPTKGLVLPFISYGGSALLVNCAAVGILLNVSRARDVEELVEPEESGEPEEKVLRRGATRRNVRRGDAAEAPLQGELAIRSGGAA